MEQIGLKERKSGIELLRLIAIFSVIIYHYSYNGIDFSGFSYTNLDFNHIFLQLIQTHGSLACSIFALMTGYFLVDKEIGVAYWKKYINVILVVFSYSTIFTALIYAGGV